MSVNPIENHAICFICGLPEEAVRLTFLRDLSASALKFVADPSFGGSAVQSPSPCTEIALARLATQTPEYPKNLLSIRVEKNGLGA